MSPVSGCVFEQRLITKHLAENATDPINGQPLAADQLISVKGLFHNHQPHAPRIIFLTTTNANAEVFA